MICVLGVLDTPKGRAIAEDMCKWLSPIYDVHQVLHDGTQYELPALKEAQRLSVGRNEPILYLHTRGAVNVYETTPLTHAMWKYMFGDSQMGEGVRIIASAHTSNSKAVVIAPYIDNNFTTRYNGFIATPEAWKMLNLQPTKERHDYERLWRGTKAEPFGILINREDNAIIYVREHLKIYFS